MQAKKKICPTCGKEKYLWNKKIGCMDCVAKSKAAGNKQNKTPLKRTPIKKVGSKRQKQIEVYKVLKKQYLKDHPICEICGRKSEIIHHKMHRENERINDTGYWMALCGGLEPCHKYIHANPKESYEKGWLIKG